MRAWRAPEYAVTATSGWASGAGSESVPADIFTGTDPIPGCILFHRGYLDRRDLGAHHSTTVEMSRSAGAVAPVGATVAFRKGLDLDLPEPSAPMNRQPSEVPRHRYSYASGVSRRVRA